ncbi:hypothetical protein [Rhodanobacter sp. 115]|uniref:hypothetical protein n=1 Tax=Rhodanobacter sp. FW021-MT20 TaxID=1162282 RepID=UPI0003093D73|nr:hypothetical protein [Rhodanobacter sp. 115]
MDALNQRIVLVTRKTRLEELIVRFNTIEQARFYVEHLGADFSDYEAEHRVYLEAVRTAEVTLGRFGRVQRLDRGFLSNYLFAPDALVVVLGQDGLVANTLKYLKGGHSRSLGSIRIRRVGTGFSFPSRLKICRL